MRLGNVQMARSASRAKTGGIIRGVSEHPRITSKIVGQAFQPDGQAGKPDLRSYSWMATKSRMKIKIKEED